MNKKIERIFKYAEKKLTNTEIANKLNVTRTYVYDVLTRMRICEKCGIRCWGSKCVECYKKNNYGISYNKNNSEYSVRKGITKSTSFS